MVTRAAAVAVCSPACSQDKFIAFTKRAELLWAATLDASFAVTRATIYLHAERYYADGAVDGTESLELHR